MLQKPSQIVIASDGHEFIGRIFDLSIVGLNFISDEEASQFPDAKYVLDVNDRVTLLTQRLESLNGVGELLWPEKPFAIEALSTSAYHYCNFVYDAFLMRLISVFDCCCLLAVDVLELELAPRRASPAAIRKLTGGHACCDALDRILDVHNDIRFERNIRFHRGQEMALSSDDQTFKIVSRFSSGGQPMSGHDRNGQEIDLSRYFDEAITKISLKFDSSARGLIGALDPLYSSLGEEFEARFRIKCASDSSFMRKSRR